MADSEALRSLLWRHQRINGFESALAEGYKFHLNTKRRVSWAGESVDYLACDSL